MIDIEKMKERFVETQIELKKIRVTGESGAGLVSVTLNGSHEACRVSLDDSLLKEDKKVIEDLIVAAINSAVNKVQDSAQDQYSRITSMLDLPILN